ncbi:MAG: NAD(P)H-hydrate dehydratase [Limnochordaceae bacterium]|nr:NAD(P)H-hydrate dehydratase [Limnochordaceae bacterium]
MLVGRKGEREVWIATAQQLRELDRRTTTEAAVPVAVLMEHAGLAVARRVAALLRRSLDEPDGLGGTRIAVFCGPGNNGGDGSVAARLLAAAGATVHLCLIGTPQQLRDAALANYQAASAFGVDLCPVEPNALEQPVNTDRLRFVVGASDVIIDALLGTGARLPLSPTYHQVIRLINQAGKPVVAVDLPTGVATDNGQMDEVCVQATCTVTFGWLKPGLVLYPAAERAGEVWVEPIAFPPQWLEVDPGSAAQLITPELLRPFLTPRPADTHKGTYGHLLVWGGSPGMVGAPRLVARAALRSGAGLVTVAGPAAVVHGLNDQLPDALTLLLPEGEAAVAVARDGYAKVDAAVSLLIERAATCRAVVIGPGLGQAEQTGRQLREFVERLIPAIQRSALHLPRSPADASGSAESLSQRPIDAGGSAESLNVLPTLPLSQHPVDAGGSAETARSHEVGPSQGESAAAGQAGRTPPLRVVLDADGLNWLAQGVLPVPLPGQLDWVLTPHPGEMARLLGWSSQRVQENRWEAARQAASRFGAVVVLKGAHTVIAAPDGSFWVNPTGNPGMAVGGMGDVLAGVIGALLLNPGVSATQAAVMGVYLHGLAGDVLAHERGETALMASDLPDALGLAWSLLNRAVQGEFGSVWRQRPLARWYLDIRFGNGATSAVKKAGA